VLLSQVLNTFNLTVAVIYINFLCVFAFVCADTEMCARQTDIRLAAATLPYFKFNLRNFRCACVKHNKVIATGNAQISL
jgi:hypothetical protein